MIIDTQINEQIVTIDGEDYTVAPKTIAVAEKIERIDEQNTKAYEKWLAVMEVLIGREAVKKIFPNGKNENLDRIEDIYYKIVLAFDSNGSRLRQQRAESNEELDVVLSQVEKLKPYLEIINKYPAVKR